MDTKKVDVMVADASHEVYVDKICLLYTSDAADE